MTTITRPPARAEWLELRERYWNASDTAALFDEHPYASLADVAVRKLTGLGQAETSAMRRGNHLEAAVAGWWSDEHGIAVVETDRLFLYDELVLATPDYLIVGNDDEVVEIKTTNKVVLEPMRYWWWQCQAQMLAGDLVRVHLVVLDSSMDLQTFVIERDDDACEQVATRARIFMDAVRAGEVPEVELGYEHQLALHPISVATEVELDDDQAALVKRLVAARAFKRQAEDEEERVRGELAALLGDADTACHHGTRLLTWKTSTRSRLDERALRHQHPELAEAFTTTSSYRTMRTLS